ncbi:MAG: hypothetical protein QW356_07050 [Candidatus Hadarchaeales archaeon]
MSNRSPEEEEDFIKLWKFFKWVDEVGWSDSFIEPRFQELKKIFPGFSNSDLTLAHWLTYVYNYVIGVERIWHECLLIMSYVAWKFQGGGGVDEIKEEVEGEDGGFSLPDEYVKKLHPGCKSSSGEVCFKHFPTKTNPRVWRTLRILDKMGERDFVKFLKRWKTVKDAAKALFVLTYSKESEDRSIERLKKGDFKGIEEEDLLEAPKRLWSALQEYVKDDKTFLGEKPAGWRPEELELPQDKWNEKFFEGVVRPRFEVLLRLTLPRMRENFPPRKFLRELYRQKGSKLQNLGLYPAQFDVTFDLRCSFGNCQFCPLGGEEWRKRCEDARKSGNPCPILEHLFGYAAACEGEKCPLLSDPPPVVCGPRISGRPVK